MFTFGSDVGFAHNYAKIEDLKIATGRFQITGGTGNQVISGVGFQPKAYILFLTANAVDNTESPGGTGNGMRFSIGMTNGTRQFCMSTGEEDNQGTTDVARRMNVTAVLCSFDVQESQVNQGNATHVSMDTDGFTIRKHQAFSNPSIPLVQYIAFGGSELKASVDTVNLANSVGSSIVVNSPNFSPDLVFTSYVGNREDAPGDPDNDDNSFSFGWAINPTIQAANNQYSINIASRDGQDFADSYTNMSNKYAGLSHRDGTFDTAYDINTFTSLGFSVTTRSVAATDSDPTEHMGYLALDFGNNPKIYSTDTTASSSTGNIAYTGTVFKPTFLLGIGGPNNNAFNTVANGGTMSVGFTNGTHTYALSEWTDDGNDPSNVASRTTSGKFWQGYLDTGTQDYQASFVSFNSNGWTLNYDDSTASGSRQAFLAIRAPEINNAIVYPDAAVPGINIAVQIIGSGFTDADVVTTNSSDIVVGPIIVSNSNGAKVSSGGTLMQTTLFINGTATPGAVEILINGVPLRYPFNIIDRTDHFVGTGDFASAPGTPVTIVRAVSTATDDAEEDTTNGDVNTGSSDLEMVDEPIHQLIGMRFQNIAIPPGATITNAQIQFAVDQTDNQNPSSIIFKGQDLDNAPTFNGGGGTFDISGRTPTTASVTWSPPNWNTAGQAGPDQLTPNLSSIIQEIVDRGGWVSGNSLVIMTDDASTGKRTADSQDTNDPVLSITYLSSGPFTLGDDTGVNGNRTLAGTIVLDSLIIPAGITVQIDTTDIDPNLAGNQGYLPAIIIVDGPVDIRGTLNISGSNGQDGNNDNGGAGGYGGPGGGGGAGGGGGGDNTPAGGCVSNNAIGGDGGDGFTGGGAGSANIDCAGTLGGDGGDGTGAVGALNVARAGGAGGVSILNTATGGGGGGGTGFAFGTGGGGGSAASSGAAGFGGAGGALDGDDNEAGGGGFGEAGQDLASNGGEITGNIHLLPIAGGSGGGGGGSNEHNGADDGSGGGGGGGGAILIYGTGNFQVGVGASGVIDAIGGTGGNDDGDESEAGEGGGGSGGAIIFQGVRVDTNGGVGTLDVSGGAGGPGGSPGGTGGDGRVRVDGLPIGTTTVQGLPGGFGGTSFVGPSITGVNNTHVNGTGTTGSGVITLQVKNAGTFTT